MIALMANIAFLELAYIHLVRSVSISGSGSNMTYCTPPHEQHSFYNIPQRSFSLRAIGYAVVKNFLRASILEFKFSGVSHSTFGNYPAGEK